MDTFGKFVKLPGSKILLGSSFCIDRRLAAIMIADVARFGCLMECDESLTPA